MRLAIYTGTPYVDSLTQQLGARLGELTKLEVKNFAEYRLEHIRLVENAEAPESERRAAAEWLKSAPSQLRHTGAEILGPKVLDPGQTSRLPYVLLGDNLRRYVVGFFELYVRIEGSWEYVGYTTLKGDVLDFNQEPVLFRRDDLDVIMDKTDGWIDVFGSVFRSFLSYAEKNEVSSGDGFLESVSSGLSSDVSSSLCVKSATPSSPLDRIKTNARKITSSSAPSVGGAPSSGGSYSVEGVQRILDADVDRPSWYKQIRYSSSLRETLKKFMAEVGVPVYEHLQNRLGSQFSLEAYWDAAEKVAKSKGFIGDQCKVISDKDIKLNDRGACVFIDRCPHRSVLADGSCQHQGIKLINKYA